MEIADHTVVITIKQKNKLEVYHQLIHKQITGEINHSEEIEFQKSFQVLAPTMTDTRRGVDANKE